MKRSLGFMAVTAALAGCGSSSSSKYVATPSGGQGATVPVAIKHASFGQVLAGANGRTLYLFLADHGAKSSCSGACAAVWPPLTAHATAGAGAAGAMLGTTSSGQVTYAGHPLYYFARDKDSGDAYGEGLKSFGAEWYAVGAKGQRVEKKGS